MLGPERFPNDLAAKHHFPATQSMTPGEVVGSAMGWLRSSSTKFGTTNYTATVERHTDWA